MSFSRRDLEKLIGEIRQKSRSLDETYAAILKRWRDDEQAINALRDILASAEKTYGTINESDVAALIDLVLIIRWYAEKTDQDYAKALKLRRELKRGLSKERTLLMRALRKQRISAKYAIRRMTEIDRIGVNSARPSVRSSKNGSRIRTLFMTELSTVVHENGGIWMDEQVAAIASMVFECEVYNEQVRNTRRR